jgi:hypothetical protein
MKPTKALAEKCTETNYDENVVASVEFPDAKRRKVLNLALGTDIPHFNFAPP